MNILNIVFKICSIFSSTRNQFICMIILLFSIIIHYLINNNYSSISLETEKCPFCYGENCCSLFDNNEIHFANLTFREKVSNMINMKNVYIANYNDKKVVLKKLGHNWELANIDYTICKDQNSLEDCPPYIESYTKDYTPQIIEFLINDNTVTPSNLKICSLSTATQLSNILFSFYSHLNTSVMTANIWTILLANAEPLLLQILSEKEGWPVPVYYGACGRVIIEEYSGKALHSVGEEPWIKRAALALELLQAAEDFTSKHPLFRFYLTDISSDNIVVTDNNKIKFIDLENVIITEKNTHFENPRPHESENFDCDSCYAFSSDEICSHSVSDHNFYSVCKLLLSKNAPWPMIENGLLHSPPNYIVEIYPQIFKYVEICAESSEKMNRFEASKKLIQSLKSVLYNEGLNL